MAAITDDLQLNSHLNGETNGHANGPATGLSNEPIKEAFSDDSVAISPNTPELVPGLLDQVAAHGTAFASSDAAARTDLLHAARQLVYALETPREAMIRFCWSQVRLTPWKDANSNNRVSLVNSLCLFGDCRGLGPLEGPFAR